jgi:3-methyladenine DNA glycosylase Tag
VRNGQKIMAVRDNARFIVDIAKEHGSFGKFLSQWPADDMVGLLEVLAKRGKRLGGNTGQYLLRFLGKDGFMTSRDVVVCLRDAGLDITEKPTSKRDMKKIQDQFNAWAKKSGRPLSQISRICAMSIGDNLDNETLRRRAGGDD